MPNRCVAHSLQCFDESTDMKKVAQDKNDTEFTFYSFDKNKAPSV